MSEYILPIEILIEQFRKLPGVGRKTAARYAMAVLNMSEETVNGFSDALLSAKRDISFCKVCGNICEGDICDVCNDTDRERVLCIVEDALLRQPETLLSKPFLQKILTLKKP